MSGVDEPNEPRILNQNTVDVGKVFIDHTGAGRLYIPRNIIQALALQHKEHVRLEASEGTLSARSLKNVS